MRKKAPTEEELKRDRLKELTNAPAWPILEEWVKERVMELYKRFEGCKNEECTRVQGSLEAYKRILDMKKSLRSDDIIRKATVNEEDE